MFIIKSAQEKDLPVIQNLAIKIWPVAYGHILSPSQLDYMLNLIYSIPALKEQLNILRHSFYIIEENGYPAGFASTGPHAEVVRKFILHKIYILPAFQGKQAGLMLLEKVKHHARKKGATLLQLNVNRENKARFFYEKNGFKILQAVDIDIGEGYFMNDFIMECPI